MLLSRKRLAPGPLVCLLAIGAVIALGACGIRPLYGQKHGASPFSVKQSLALIEIQAIENRIGQQLHNNLLARLNPKGRSQKPAYSLVITVTESITNLGVRKSATVTRGNLRVIATYSLTSIRGAYSGTERLKEETLTSGRVLATSSYDISQEQYSALAAAKNARTRAVKEISDDIQTRLAVYFQQTKN
ncbi:MAG TPA: LPS assembly lipoprotein LptE [Rhodospirillales bacterium]|nr:LPS assembly lipoprotein LptE [Rhodospirillales bacterium]